MSVIPYVAYDVRVNLQLYDGINITYGQIFAMIAMTAMMFFLLGEGIFRLLKQLTEGLFQTADNLFAIYREETASSPAIPLSVMECLISGIAAVLIAFALTIQQDSARYADFMISFWRYAAALLPSAFCLYMGMFMRRAKNISIFSIKDNAVGILLPPCLYALIVFVGSMIASLTQNGFLTVIGVLRYFLGVILSAILSYFFILVVRMYIKHFENFSIIFLMFFSPFAFLNLIAIVLPELHIQFLNPIYLPCGYLLSGLSASWEGFISFAYQFAYYLFFAAAGGWVVLKYYIRCYESLVKKPDYLSIRAFLLMVRYRDRGNL